MVVVRDEKEIKRELKKIRALLKDCDHGSPGLHGVCSALQWALGRDWMGMSPSEAHVVIDRACAELGLNS